MTKIVFPFVLLILCCSWYSGLSQNVITTSEGKKVILNEDGTWSDYQASTALDTTQSLTEADVISTKVENTGDKVQVNPREKSEMEDFNMIKVDIAKRVLEAESKQAANKEELKRIKREIQLAKTAKSLKLDIKELEKKKLEFYLEEYDLEQAVNKINPLKYTVESLEGKAYNREQYLNLKKMYSEYLGLPFVELKATAIETSIPDANTTMPNEDMTHEVTTREQEMNPGPAVELSNEKSKPIKTESELALEKYGFQIDKRDVLREPIKDDCRIIKQGIDSITKKLKIELASEHLFGYTHPNIKSFFKEKDYLNCNAKLTRVGGLYFLSLEVRIASLKANKTYGSIDKGSVLRVKFIDDETMILHNITQSTGIIEPLTGVTVYRVNYPMEKSEFKQLAKSELDKMGLIWSTGYEEYEIYKVDFLMNQAECLNKL